MIIISLVYISMQQDLNLVRADYYNEELAYQDQIDRINNYKNLLNKPEIKRYGDVLSINFPQENIKMEKGQVWLYRPSVSEMDRKFEMKLDDKNQSTIPLHGLKVGLWKIKLSWSDGSKEFFTEESIVL